MCAFNHTTIGKLCHVDIMQIDIPQFCIIYFFFALCVPLSLLYSNNCWPFGNLIKGEALLTIGYTNFGNKSYSYIHSQISFSIQSCRSCYAYTTSLSTLILQDFCLSNLLIKSISDEGYIYVILYYYLIVNFFLFIK